MRVHQDVSKQFMSALQLPKASWRARAGWWLLLNVLRLPGAARLLAVLRSRS
jgi:hypothetical protein